MSLTARMMLSLLTRQEVRRIVRYVMNSPSVKAVNRLMISTTPAMIVIVLRTVKRFVSCMAPVVALLTASIFDPYAQSSVVEFAGTLGLVLHSKFGASG